MDHTLLGKLIEYERTTKNIRSNKLTKGVCSVATLHRLEYGKRLPSFFVLERLLERLGKSANKIEFLYHETDYEIYYLREKTEKVIEENRFAEAEDMLNYYDSIIDKLSPDRGEYQLHIQYIYKLRAIIFAYRREYGKAEQLLLNALEITVPDIKAYIRKEREKISVYRLLKEML